MNNKSEERIEKMRNGEKIKCTRCSNGFISASGNPETTNVFRCDHCQTAIVLTVPLSRSL